MIRRGPGGVCLVFALALASSGAGPGTPASHVPRPFTAEQIRGEWVEGLTLVLQRVTPGAETRERWIVVSADAEGAEIEFTPLDAQDRVTGPSRRRRSTWVELRDHATFPAATTTREEVTRATPPGTFEGWLFIVSDAAQGTVTEYFFARDLPGAPLELKTTRNGETLVEMKQISRSRP
jgi:hypothetical protein